MPPRVGLSLQVTGLSAGYDGSTVLHAVDLEVPAGTVCAVLGANGAGKTTLIHAVMGIGSTRATSGRIRLDTGHGIRDVARWAAHRRARTGMALVPQGRRVFAGLTVAEHVKLLRGPTTVARAARQRADRDTVWTVERLLTVFPQLGQRLTTAGDAATIEAEFHVEILNTDVMNDLIERPLQKSRVDRADRFQPFARKTGRESHTMLFRDADIE